MHALVGGRGGSLVGGITVHVRDSSRRDTALDHVLDDDDGRPPAEPGRVGHLRHRLLHGHLDEGGLAGGRVHGGVHLDLRVAILDLILQVLALLLLLFMNFSMIGRHSRRRRHGGGLRELLVAWVVLAVAPAPTHPAASARDGLVADLAVDVVLVLLYLGVWRLLRGQQPPDAIVAGPRSDDAVVHALGGGGGGRADALVPRVASLPAPTGVSVSASIAVGQFLVARIGSCTIAAIATGTAGPTLGQRLVAAPATRIGLPVVVLCNIKKKSKMYYLGSVIFVIKQISIIKTPQIFIGKKQKPSLFNAEFLPC